MDMNGISAASRTHTGSLCAFRTPYREKFFTSNVHSILHLPDFVNTFPVTGYFSALTGNPKTAKTVFSCRIPPKIPFFPGTIPDRVSYSPFSSVFPHPGTRGCNKSSSVEICRSILQYPADFVNTFSASGILYPMTGEKRRGRSIHDAYAVPEIKGTETGSTKKEKPGASYGRTGLIQQQSEIKVGKRLSVPENTTQATGPS